MADLHTPGPWRIDGLHQLDGWGHREGEDHCELASLPHPTFDALEIFARRARDDYEEHAANARLIAASPELFAALDYARNLIGPDEVIDAAIAKAKGRS